MNTYKVCLIGNARVGKTSYVHRLMNISTNENALNPVCIIDFDQRIEQEYGYKATLGVEVHPIVFRTNIGPVKINFWDCAGDESLGGLVDGYYINADAFLVMSTPQTIQHATKWLNDAKRVRPNSPVYNCYNIDGRVTHLGTNKDPIQNLLRRLTNTKLKLL